MMDLGSWMVDFGIWIEFGCGVFGTNFCVCRIEEWKMGDPFLPLTPG